MEGLALYLPRVGQPHRLPVRFIRPLTPPQFLGAVWRADARQTAPLVYPLPYPHILWSPIPDASGLMPPILSP